MVRCDRFYNSEKESVMKETVPVTVAEREVRGFNEEYEPTLFGKVISRVY